MIIALFSALLLSLQPSTEPRVIGWGDLLPEEELAEELSDGPVIDHESGGRVAQTGSSQTVAELEGAYIRMPGYLLPLDYSEKGLVRAFLLVPYYGACIHVPPPPPNQIVFVDTGENPVKSRGLWDPVWVTGTMRLQGNDNNLGDTAYTLELSLLEDYED